MKKWAVLAVSLALIATIPVKADVISDLVIAESTFGIDNTDKTAIERVEILEEQLGITDVQDTLAGRLEKIKEELGISPDAALESIEEEETETPVDNGEKLAIAPSDEFVMERLKLIGTITDMAPVTEDHDPNGQLNKQGGYIGCIYFKDIQVDRSEIYNDSDDVVDVGTQGGGAIEIFKTFDEASVREAYLATLDGTGFASGSHQIVGTCLIRTSVYLTASQQNALTDKIIQVLTAEDPSELHFEEVPEDIEDEEDTTEENSGFELYNHDGYTITAMGFEQDDPIWGNILKLRIQNLTHHNVVFSDSGSYVNGSMMTLGAYFQIASGKTKTNDLYIDKKNLEDAGIDKIEDITLNFDVYDNESYATLTKVGPLSISIDENGNIANKLVYRDNETIREVQTLLNAAGYDCGSADGIAGKKTNDKILQFERDHGLREDTDITDELLEALRGN